MMPQSECVQGELLSVISFSIHSHNLIGCCCPVSDCPECAVLIVSYCPDCAMTNCDCTMKTHLQVAAPLLNVCTKPQFNAVC